MNVIRLVQRSAIALFVGLLLPVAAQAQAVPAEFRIGFQKGTLNLSVLKARGTLEQRLKGTRVSWIEFPAGPQLLEALAVGSIDVGSTGDSPPVFAQAADKDLVYIGYEAPKPDTSAILVAGNSSIHSLEDLKGKKIAVQKGSSAHFLTVQAVKKAKLAWTDIQPVYLAPADARAAFESGAVDAWAIWDPYYAAAESTGKARVLATSRGLSNNNTFYLAASGFASKYPNAILDFLDELTSAERYTHDSRKETVQLLTKVLGLDAPIVDKVISRRPVGAVSPMNAEVLNEQQTVADAFQQLGLIPKAIRVADIAWKPSANDLAKR